MQHNLPFTEASQSPFAGSCPPVASRSWRPVVAALGLLSISVGAMAQNRAFPLAQAAERVARPLSAAPVAVPAARPVAAHKALSAISSTATGGNWSAPATWVGGVVPTAADDVTIVAGATVTLDVAASAASITVAATGSLLNSATTSYSLQVAGSVTNNGTLDLSASSSIGSDLRFTGAGNAAFAGTGTTDLQSMTLAKSVRADVVEMTLPAFTVQGGTPDLKGFLLTRTTGATPADDMTGTLKISGTATLTARVFGSAASYIIPATGGFWLNNPNFTVTGQTGSPTVNGSLQITTGTFNVGNSIGNSMVFTSGAVYTQQGGTFNTVGRFGSFTSATAAAAITFTLSGGTMNISTVGNASATPSFGVNGTNTVSGGTINLVQRSTATTPLDYYVAGTYAYTGGTVNIGTAATATNFDFRVRGTFPNMTVDNTTNAKSALLSGQTNVYGTALITPSSTLNLNGQLLLQLGNTFTNNGILAGTVAASTLYMAGSAPQTVGGSGTFSTLRVLTIDNNGGGVTLTVPLVVNRVNLFTGNLNGAANLTIGDGSLAFFVIQVGVAATATSGAITSAPVFNIGSGALQLIYAPELTPRTTGFEIPATRIVDAITIGNPAGVILAGGNLAVNASGVSNSSLILTSGILTTSAGNVLTLGTAAAVIPTGSATSYVKGPLGITVNSATAVSRTFAVGDAAGWRPVVVSGITAATDQVFTATVVNGATGGSVSGALSSLNPARYVRLQNSASLPVTARVQLSYGADDALGNVATAVVAQAPTAAGTYASIGGAAATTPTTGLVSTLDLTPGNDFFVLANTEGGTLTTSVAAVCAGTNSGTITLANNAGTIVNYQANSGSGFVDVAGTNTASTYAFTNLTATTTFRAVILTADNRTVFSAPVTVTVTPAPTATLTATTPTTFCAGGSVVLTAPAGTGNTYQFFNGTTSLGAASATNTFTATAAGSYTVVVTNAATCQATSTATTVTVNPATTATFAYSGTTFCASGTNPTPTVTGTSGGTFSSTSGLSINATTGAINLSASTLGIYTVTYTVAGACGSSATASVTITAGQVATFSYGTTSSYCVSGTTAPAVVLGTGATAGVFSSITGLTINATTGAITLSSSTPGTYTVTNTVAAANGCAATTATSTVTITAAPVATFSYASATYCVTGTNPAPVLAAGASAGSFLASVPGLVVNANTGVINLAASTPGTYTVTNGIGAAGGCAVTSATVTVTITAAPTATFSYATTSACAGSATLLPAALGTGATAGTFSSTTGLTLNATTGAVNPATSTAGTYTVTNTVAAAGGCAATTSTATVTINALPATPTFSYTYPTPGTVLFTSSVAPAGTTYQWYVGTTPITGATSQTYTANGATAPGTYTVRFVSTATGCQSAASTSLVVTSSVKPLAGTSLNVYPNPTHDGNLKVELTGYRATAELTVLNALGQVVFAATVPASNGTTTQAVNLTQLSTGIYILQVKTAGGLDTRRVTKE